ncbi:MULTISPECIES: amino acid ABC transporter permease [Pseudomonas]|uniref:amino acid ABC transporter permease n=1 Tax=Pseudomonas TaxID=286 RepID=UPI000B4F505B|nr:MULTISPECIES: amino acid ABC transporter permease [Pseudomonas]MBB3271374.1 polar amino acid transport system permease protein [Pseudomonas sp. OG7]MCE5988786.1 amino acid ABC transporter permease [Pseudomonas sp. LM20]POA89317.1 amino acid ABC transporter permease [Pseudomonas sp. FW305-E2]PYB93670.1 amino acid ABC transporter permease [Pseudomonas fulva]PYC16496.1 amino acid ABC transporter permease [Pseudomonas fulva]
METSQILAAMLAALPWTIALTFGSFIGGAIIGIPICAMRISKHKILRNIAIALILTLRSIPPIVWLFFIFFAFSQYVIQLSPFVAAIIGLALITSANMAEIYRGALSAVPKGQYEATKVLGLSTWQKYVHVIVPQVVRISVPAASTYCIGLLKDTAIASTIGVSELAQVANHISQETFRGLSVYAIAGLLYFAVSVVMALLSRQLDIHLRAKVER